MTQRLSSPTLLALALAGAILPGSLFAELPRWVQSRPQVLAERAPEVQVQAGHVLLCWRETDPRDETVYWALVKVPLVGDLPQPVDPADAAWCGNGQ